jgi:hypothetical protein
LVADADQAGEGKDVEDDVNEDKAWATLAAILFELTHIIWR